MFPHLFSTTVLILHWLIVVGLFLRVIMRRPPVGVAVAWLAVISSTPFVGAVVYLLFGERRLGRRREERIAATLDDVQHWQRGLRDRFDAGAGASDDLVAPLRRQAEAVLGTPALVGNSTELFEDFQAVFDALVADIDRARVSCRLCFYIWGDGGRTADVLEALERAAGRGIRCRVLADAIGSRAFLGGARAARLRRAGVEVRAALPTGALRTLFVRRDLRNHRKLAVIDDRVAYAGSQNLVDPRFFNQKAGVGEWVDAMVRVTGPAAAALAGVFALDWAVESGQALDLPTATDVASGSPGAASIQVVPSGPGLRPEALHQLLLTAIYAARRELVMTTPYFVPDESILMALLSAAQRGVEVTLIVPARNDSLLVRYASVAHFDDLLSAGATIALFEGGLLHTKSLTIDGELAIFGSVNLDMRSLWLNFEISLFVVDPDFAGRLKSLQRTYRVRSRTLELEAWRRRPAWRRLTENAFRLLGPLL